MTLQLQKRRGGSLGSREGVHIKHTSQTGAGGGCHLFLGGAAHRAFAKHCRQLPLLHEANDPRQPLRRDLGVPVHRPEIGLLQAIVPGQVTEGPLTGHQEAPLFRQAGNGLTQLFIQLQQLLVVGRRIGGKGLPVLRRHLREGLAQVLHIHHGQTGRHPGMGIGTPRHRRVTDGQGFDALGEGHPRDRVGQIGVETLPPTLHVETVIHDQHSRRRLPQVTGGGFVAMNLGARLDEGCHLQVVPRYGLGQIRQDGEAGQHPGAGDLLLAQRAGGCAAHQCREDYDCHEVGSATSDHGQGHQSWGG